MINAVRTDNMITMSRFIIEPSNYRIFDFGVIHFSVSMKNMQTTVVFTYFITHVVIVTNRSYRQRFHWAQFDQNNDEVFVIRGHSSQDTDRSYLAII